RAVLPRQLVLHREARPRWLGLGQLPQPQRRLESDASPAAARLESAPAASASLGSLSPAPAALEPASAPPAALAYPSGQQRWQRLLQRPQRLLLRRQLSPHQPCRTPPL